MCDVATRKKFTNTFFWIEWTRKTKRTISITLSCARRVHLSAFIFAIENYRFFSFVFFVVVFIRNIIEWMSLIACVRIWVNKKRRKNTRQSNDRFIPFVRQRKCIARFKIASDKLSLATNWSRIYYETLYLYRWFDNFARKKKPSLWMSAGKFGIGNRADCRSKHATWLEWRSSACVTFSTYRSNGVK